MKTRRSNARVPVLFPVLALAVALGACRGAPETEPSPKPPSDRPYLVVLGIAQDAGVPQAGTREHPAWDDSSRRRMAVCLGMVDPRSGRRFLFEPTPDFKWQLRRLDRVAPPVGPVPGLDGVFLTHAHMGHYLGLAWLGHESIGAKGVPVYAMPRMATYLSENGPWDQLVRYGNVELQPMSAGEPVELASDLRVMPILVPHRQEYSEVVAYRIEGPEQSVLFLPDIDSWKEWDALGTRLEDVLDTVDVAYLDATFYANGEIPGRDMSGFPHPFITTTMSRLGDRSAEDRAQVRFIHFNHTNPALDPDSPERAAVLERGFRLAEELEIVPL